MSRADIERPLVMSGARAQSGMTSAASKGYALVSSWEKSSSLSESQLLLVSTLANECSAPPMPEHYQHEEDLSTTLGDSMTKSTSVTVENVNGADSFAGHWEDAVLHNGHQFYKWHSELEAARRKEIEDQYAKYLTTLSDRLALTDDVTTRVDSSLSALSSLQSHHATVTKKVETVRSSCERLMHEKDMLAQYADALAGRLGYFDELEAIATEFTRLSARQDNTNVMPLLSRLDECIAYMASNPQYVDTMSYTLRLRQLQGKTLGLILNKVQQVVLRATEAVREDIARGGHPGSPTAQAPAAPAPTTGFSSFVRSGSFGASTVEPPELTSGAASAVLSVRFRAVCEPQLGPILHELMQRSKQPEYVRLLEDCEQAYCSARSQLVLPFVQQHVARLQSPALPDLTRQGCAYLLDICRAEAQLAAVFFPATTTSPALSALMETLCTVLYDALRPRYILMHSIDDLCEIVDILRHEMSAEGLAAGQAASHLLAPTIDRITADVQERLIYRAQTFLREEVSNYQPTPEDYDFPRRLVRLREQATASNGPSANGTTAEESNTAGHSDSSELPISSTQPTLESSPLLLPNAIVPSDFQRASSSKPSAEDYSTWYPPLRQTLLLLAKLYCSIELDAFSGLGQDALALCTHSIQRTSKLVLKQSGPLDAQLFTIRHLLLLREQIAPFDAEFTAADRDLDFTHMHGQLRRMMTGDMPLFNFSSQNAVVQIVTRGGFRVLEQSVDSKKELEKTLKGCCEAFIMTVTKAVVEPMLSFITKVTALRVSNQGKANAKPISEHAFASPEKLAAIVTNVNAALEKSCTMAIAKMQLYLEKPKTQSVLLKPIANNIIEAHGQIAMLLDTSYTPEAAATVPLKTSQELDSLLNGLLVPI